MSFYSSAGQYFLRRYGKKYAKPPKRHHPAQIRQFGPYTPYKQFHKSTAGRLMDITGTASMLYAVGDLIRSGSQFFSSVDNHEDVDVTLDDLLTSRDVREKMRAQLREANYRAGKKQTVVYGDADYFQDHGLRAKLDEVDQGIRDARKGIKAGTIREISRVKTQLRDKIDLAEATYYKDPQRQDKRALGEIHRLREELTRLTGRGKFHSGLSDVQLEKHSARQAQKEYFEAGGMSDKGYHMFVDFDPF